MKQTFLICALLPTAASAFLQYQAHHHPLVSHLSAVASTPGSFRPLDEKSEEELANKELYSKATRQLLGVKNAATSPNEKWRTRVQLLKPLTWIPLSLCVMCGAAASGNYHWMWNPFNPADRDVILGLQDALKGLAAVVLAGPFSEGFAQTINDWYDRDIDAVNEPYRPIPSGAISPTEVFQQLRFLFVGGLLLAVGLDYAVDNTQQLHAVTTITLLGYFMSYIYSAPPLKLKQNGWTGDLAIGLCYISFPWWCGQAVFGGTFDQASDYLLPMAYSLAGIGAGIVNDFKSMEGDRQFGLQSIPVQVGVENAALLASAIPDVVQLGVAAYLFSLGETATAAFVLALVLPQIYLQSTLLLKDPLGNDVKYMAYTQPLLMLGLLATALCVGQK